MDFNIKAARDLAKYSQKDLAKKIGVSPSTLNGYENGKHDPKSDFLVKIAEVCGVSVDFLLRITDNPLPAKSKDTATDNEVDTIDPYEELLVTNYHALNEEGQEKLVEYSEDLIGNAKYKKHNEFKMDSKEA